jgi:hypothetical protein
VYMDAIMATIKIVTMSSIRVKPRDPGGDEWLVFME